MGETKHQRERFGNETKSEPPHVRSTSVKTANDDSRRCLQNEPMDSKLPSKSNVSLDCCDPFQAKSMQKSPIRAFSRIVPESVSNGLRRDTNTFLPSRQEEHAFNSRQLDRMFSDYTRDHNSFQHRPVVCGQAPHESDFRPIDSCETSTQSNPRSIPYFPDLNMDEEREEIWATPNEERRLQRISSRIAPKPQSRYMEHVLPSIGFVPLLPNMDEDEDEDDADVYDATEQEQLRRISSRIAPRPGLKCSFDFDPFVARSSPRAMIG